MEKTEAGLGGLCIREIDVKSHIQYLIYCVLVFYFIRDKNNISEPQIQNCKQVCHYSMNSELNINEKWDD